MFQRSDDGTRRATWRLARVGALGLVVITLAACATGQARVAASSGATSLGATTPTGDIDERPAIRDLMAALTRSGVGPNQVAIELTYASPLFFEVTGLAPPAETSSRPTLAFMLQETVHDGVLPNEPPAVFLVLETGAPVGPYDVKVTATDPHHRTTRLLFPDSADGSTTSEKASQEHTLKLVVPFADGTVSAGNTFVWRLPIELEPPAPNVSPRASR